HKLNPNQSGLDLTTLTAELTDQCSRASRGDLTRGEALLVSQAHTLDAVYNKLLLRAMANTDAGYISAAETYMRLALKAQSECRATVETLAALRNPPGIAFVRQANIANGPQQVNNAPPAVAEPSRARESENPPNKLLEQHPNEWMDTRAPQPTVRGDP